MKEIIQKYFSDPPSDSNYADKNVFNPPADIKNIAEVQKQLNVKFPQDYIDFLLLTNGYEGMVGESYVQFTEIEKIIEYTEGYGGEFFPWIIHIGSDGGGEMFVLDKRENPLKYGITPYIGSDEDFISLGDTFEEFIRHLYYSDFWKSKN